MGNYVMVETHLRHDQTPVLLADPTPLELVTTAWSVWTLLALVRSPKAVSLLWSGRQGCDWVE